MCHSVRRRRSYDELFYSKTNKQKPNRNLIKKKYKHPMRFVLSPCSLTLRLPQMSKSDYVASIPLSSFLLLSKSDPCGIVSP